VSAPRPTHPRWFVVLVGTGLALAFAAVALAVLAALGVDQVDEFGAFVVILLAAVAGGALSRVLVPRLPPLGRRPD
jgi:hypothetical protein